MLLRAGMPLLLLGLLSGCALPDAGPAWDGRRGYDGSGDYGYDVNASRAEARGYLAQASHNYVVPGTPDDPWGPYIQEAASRFGLPERWVREVMRQESGGRLTFGDGSLITSPVGAMGLMQVMPATYDRLRPRFGLGPDPYEPRDNILAGTAYLRDMYDRFGSPLFLAAYNAGPERVALYQIGAKILPDETENYMASISSRLGEPYARAPRRGLAELAAAAPATDYNDPLNRAYEGGGLVTSFEPTGGMAMAAPPVDYNDPINRAYEGGGLVMR
ncbi:lytic transglycosylase domain-containing protein [Roseomonas sp. ACRSG]|nr:lytic transglycosylase domain-containing protein [Roseomonas sp. ACRSG]